MPLIYKFDDNPPIMPEFWVSVEPNSAIQHAESTMGVQAGAVEAIDNIWLRQLISHAEFWFEVKAVGDTETVPSSGQTVEGDSQLGRTVLRLREMILKGEFGPGERISEHPLTVRLGVSRTPIRLALERLAHEGLLAPYPTGGFIVRKFAMDDIWNGIEVRSLIEGGAARLAAERLVHESELDLLRKTQYEMDARGEPTAESFPAFLDLNDRFHSELMRLAKNETLRQALDRLFAFPLTSPRVLVWIGPNGKEASQLFTISQNHHHSIIDAISRRQGSRAESLAREHAQLTRRNLEIALADVELLTSLPGGSLIGL